METGFVDYLNVLEGIKTRIKNLHWAADKLEVSNTMEAHKLLDELLSKVSEHQDLIAEMSQGILGNYIEIDSIIGVRFDVFTIDDVSKVLLTLVMKFSNKIADDIVYVSVKSEIENFIGELSKLNYLFSLV